jgi:3-isopropylmalate/(R)-2-methylmalate dehydratase small subunit
LRPITGRVWKYGDDINTDVIFPGKYTYTVTDPAEMAAHALEDLDSSFAATVQKNDVIVAGKNFGCGSSREQGATCLVYAGIGAVIARSFSRLFFRNAINAGLPLVQSDEAVAALAKGDEVTVDVAAGTVATPKGTFEFPPLPEAVIGIFEAGGLIPYTQMMLGTEKPATLDEQEELPGG